jgi:hypothetical protein
MWQVANIRCFLLVMGASTSDSRRREALSAAQGQSGTVEIKHNIAEQSSAPRGDEALP